MSERPKDQALPPRPVQWKQTTHSHKLSSGLHMYLGTQPHEFKSWCFSKVKSMYKEAMDLVPSHHIRYFVTAWTPAPGGYPDTCTYQPPNTLLKILKFLKINFFKKVKKCKKFFPRTGICLLETATKRESRDIKILSLTLHYQLFLRSKPVLSHPAIFRQIQSHFTTCLICSLDKKTALLKHSNLRKTKCEFYL